jgi:uncharacterized SAM-binding protein YcdF (DUF218 family)
LLLLALIALLALRNRPRTRRVIVAASLLSIVVLSMPVVAFALLRLIEPPPLDESKLATADAIVVLGGGRNRTAPEWGGVTVSGFTLQRVRYGAQIARKSSLPVMVTGGTPDGVGTAEGTLMRGALSELGVDVRWIDDASRNTRENARFAAEQLVPLGKRRVVVVTDGWHCARAVAEFERQGLEAIPAPTGFLGGRAFTVYQLVPNVDGLRYSHIAVRELLGAVWYRWTSEELITRRDDAG